MFTVLAMLHDFHAALFRGFELLAEDWRSTGEVLETLRHLGISKLSTKKY